MAHGRAYRALIPATAPRAVLLCALLTQAACAARANPSPVAPLPARIDAIVDAPPFDRTHWGILVEDLATGEVLYARAADRHFIPASNTKLVVTIAGLGELGPDWRWETAVFVVGDGAAPHTLIVQGTGDPTLSARFAESDTAALDSLARQVFAAGIRRVTGRVIIDATRFPGDGVLPVWEVGDLPYAYAAPTGAFAIAEGTSEVIRRPGSVPGARATVAVVGGPRRQPLAAEVTTDTAGATRVWDIDWRRRVDTVYVSGRLPLDAPTDTVRIASPDPVAHAGRAFLAALGRAGVRVTGSLEVIRDSSRLASLAGPRERVAARVSPPLSEVVAAILKPSQNWIAEQLVRTLGAERGEGGTWAAGLEVERAYLTGRIGIDSLAFFLRDASGLAAQDLLTPAAIVALLRHARRQPWGETFALALPAPGEKESTLENRLPGLEARLRAKTGTITNVASLSGYLRTEDGRELVFSIMTNASGLPSARTRNAIDAVVRALDTWRIP